MAKKDISNKIEDLKIEGTNGLTVGVIINKELCSESYIYQQELNKNNYQKI